MYFILITTIPDLRKKGVLHIQLWIRGFFNIILHSENPPLGVYSRVDNTYPKHGNIVSKDPWTTREGDILLRQFTSVDTSYSGVVCGLEDHGNRT